jgi:hypothetical protein
VLYPDHRVAEFGCDRNGLSKNTFPILGVRQFADFRSARSRAEPGKHTRGCIVAIDAKCGEYVGRSAISFAKDRKQNVARAGGVVPKSDRFCVRLRQN